MNLCYITALRYPSMQANRAQVAKMSEALSCSTQFKLVVSSWPQRREDIFDEYGIRSHFVVEELNVLPLFLWPRFMWYSFRIAWRLRKEPPRTIFYIRDILLASALIIVSKRFRDRFFFELHSLDRFPSVLYRIIFSRAQGVISTNTAKKKALIDRWNIDERKILVAPNGVDTELFSVELSKQEAKKSLDLPVDRRIVMYTGSAQYWKGLSLISESAKVLPEYLFVLVGAKIESSSNILIIPRVPQREVPRYLRAADVLVAPYPPNHALSRMWASPLKIVEYMASGTPMIVSDLPIMQDFVDSTTALLVSPPSTAGFTNAIHWAFSHYADMEKRAGRARAHSKHFTWKKRAQSAIQFMQNRLI